MLLAKSKDIFVLISVLTILSLWMLHLSDSTFVTEEEENSYRNLEFLDPECCAERELREVKRISQLMSRANGFQCFEYFFEALGKKLSSSNSTNTSSLNTTSLQGEFLGNILWFNGPNALKRLVNTVWKGMSCDEDGLCTLVNRIDSPPDIGIVSFEKICPELDVPCVDYI